jgi:hypothetical protein
VFRTIGVWAIVLGLALGALSFVLKRLAHEGKDRLGAPVKTGQAEAGPLQDAAAKGDA